MSLRELFRPTPKPYAWFEHQFGPTHVMASYQGRPTQALIPVDDGAVGWWQFDGHTEGPDAVLIVHLTAKEADAVAVADPYEGFLEPVRRELKDPDALIIVRTGEETHALPFQIPRTVYEAQFAELLDACALRAPGWMDRTVDSINLTIEAYKSRRDRDTPKQAKESEDALGRLRDERQQLNDERSYAERAGGFLVSPDLSPV